MRIYTLTCHDVYNYGASLQAFALQQYLISIGYESKIIDYKPEYLGAKYKLSWYVNKNSRYYNKCKDSMLFRSLYVLKRYIFDHRTNQRKSAFNDFTKKYLRLTHTYDSYIELCQDPPQGDVYIVGSDQVWNNNPLINGWDAAFFLQFGNNSVKRISYAASFGSTIECPDIMVKWLKNLNSISIREKSSEHLIKSTGINPVVVCDPVFLLNKEDWISQLGLTEQCSDYVLIYNLSGNNKKLIQDACRIAEDKGLKIHYIVVNKPLSGVINIRGAGPIKFLEEILNAQYVFSDSFHATAFSMIFNKICFIYSFISERASQRMKCLMEQADLIDYYNPVNVFQNIDSNIKITSRYYEFIKSSKEWLNFQLDDKK